MFEIVLNQLKNIQRNPSGTEQLEILMKITMFLDTITDPVEREILLKSLIDENFVLILNDIVCSRFDILFMTTKLICILSEIEEFWQYFYDIYKNILRSIYFLIDNPIELWKLQPSLIEIFIMMQIILQR